MTEYADPKPTRTWDDDIALLRRALEALREEHGDFVGLHEDAPCKVCALLRQYGSGGPRLHYDDCLESACAFPCPCWCHEDTGE